DCPNVNENNGQERLLEVEWESDAPKNYNVHIEISGFDRRGLLNEVLQAVAETKTDMTSVSGRSDNNKMATISMTVSIRNTAHLQKVV
ncbi:ACT domain-containing protein, partial [Staphylococcus sp. SIMBA_130]